MPDDIIQCFHRVGIRFWTESRRKNSIQQGSPWGGCQKPHWILDKRIKLTPQRHLFLSPAQPCGPSGMDSDEITKLDFPSAVNYTPPPTSPTTSCSFFGHIENRQELGTCGSWGLLSKDDQVIALRITQPHPNNFLALLLNSREEKKKSDCGLNFPIAERGMCLPRWETGGHLGFSNQQ